MTHRSESKYLSRSPCALHSPHQTSIMHSTLGVSGERVCVCVCTCASACAYMGPAFNNAQSKTMNFRLNVGSNRKVLLRIRYAFSVGAHWQTGKSRFLVVRPIYVFVSQCVRVRVPECVWLCVSACIGTTICDCNKHKFNILVSCNVMSLYTYRFLWQLHVMPGCSQPDLYLKNWWHQFCCVFFSFFLYYFIPKHNNRSH